MVLIAVTFLPSIFSTVTLPVFLANHAPGMFDPLTLTTTAILPFGDMARPSGASSTLIREIVCGWAPSRSMTLTMSMLPSDDPPPPLSAVSASLPFGAITML